MTTFSANKTRLESSILASGIFFALFLSFCSFSPEKVIDAAEQLLSTLSVSIKNIDLALKPKTDAKQLQQIRHDQLEEKILSEEEKLKKIKNRIELEGRSIDSELEAVDMVIGKGAKLLYPKL